MARFNGCQGSVHGKAVGTCGNDSRLKGFFLDAAHNSLQHHERYARRKSSVPDCRSLPAISNTHGVHGDETSGSLDWCKSNQSDSQFDFRYQEFGCPGYRGMRRALPSRKSMQCGFRLYLPVLGHTPAFDSFSLFKRRKIQPGFPSAIQHRMPVSCAVIAPDSTDLEDHGNPPYKRSLGPDRGERHTPVKLIAGPGSCFLPSR